MRTVKIVADSSANLMELKTVAFDAAPLKIITGQREFVDDRNLDLDEMIAFFKSYKGRSQSSCPNPEDWLTTFGDAEDVFCVAITSGLSGSYNAACIAKQILYRCATLQALIITSGSIIPPLYNPAKHILPWLHGTMPHRQYLPYIHDEESEGYLHPTK